MHRWDGTEPPIVELQARYRSGVRRRVQFTDAKKMEAFLEKRTTCDTWVILSQEVIRLYSWVVYSDDGQRFAEAFDWDVNPVIRRALRTNFILPSL